MGVGCPPFYGKDEKFYIDEALDKIEILKERFPDAIDDLLYVAECIKHLSDDNVPFAEE
jgi:hypothetical protein|nr:MAG TPA: hypothetical protein [Bacteriophage sp.]